MPEFPPNQDADGEIRRNARRVPQTPALPDFV
jgi:hypothetical protein